ncbi:MAG: hypothetical protein GY789_10830 [Hyphomicrobiales bacterium]|nr:hypothetical protein [Hyphomicrobiales bacterium]
MIGKTLERLKASIYRAPITWILAALLVFSVYSHYQTGARLTEVCQRFEYLKEGYYDAETSQGFLTKGFNINEFIRHAEEQQRLLAEDSPEGRAYRWWVYELNEIGDFCDKRLAEPEPNYE